jgi:DNA gyrase/topoisomerase IV subunit A
MSSVVKTRTPFINKQLLLQALEAIGCVYSIEGDTVITDRVDYRGKQKFVFKNGKYLFVHESGDFGLRQYGDERHKPAHIFLGEVEKAYNAIYKKQIENLERRRLAAIAEAERLRKEQSAEQERLHLLVKAEEERKQAEAEKLKFEQERKEYVAKQRTAIIERAKEQGYDIQETVAGNKIKLILVQTTY